MIRLLLASLGIECVVEFLAGDTSLKIGFVPTAGDVYENPDFVERDRSILGDLGYSLQEIPISKFTRDQLENVLSDIDAVFVAGGNTFYLMQEARKSGFAELIAKHVLEGLPYIGASAGAIIVGPSLEPIVGIDDPSKAPNLGDMNGIGLVDFVVLPHYGHDNSVAKYDSLIEKYRGQFQLQLLRDDQVVVVEDGKSRVIPS